MKLYWSSRSPFVRKAMFAAHELGLEDRIVTERVVVAADAVNEAVMAANPLGKIPTLVLSDGSALFDSSVICEYLDQLAGNRLFPPAGPARWQALRWQAMGNGLMELLVARLGESRRAEGMRSEPHLAAQLRKITATLDALEREAGALAAVPFGIGHIAVFCGLAHADFRFAALGWRQGRPALAAWATQVAERPAARATEFVDTY